MSEFQDQPNSPEVPDSSKDQIKSDSKSFDFDRMDKDVEEFRREIRSREKPPGLFGEEADEYTDQVPAYFTPIRRRRKQTNHQAEPNLSFSEKVTALLEKATPNLDWFVLSIMSGLILSMGYILDSNALLMLGIFMTPFLGPWIGILISSMINEIKLLKLTSGGFSVGLFLTFTSAAILGVIARFVTPVGSNQVYYHSHLWWPDLFMVVIGTILLTLRFVQSDTQPIIPSLMLAYGFYLPLSVSGYGLGFGAQDLFVDGLLVFAIHLSISLIITVGLLVYLGFKPRTLNEGLLPASLFLVSLVLLFLINEINQSASSQAIPTSPPVMATSSPAPENVVTSVTQTSLPLPSPTSIPTITKTIPPELTITPAPTLPTDIILPENSGIFGKILAFGSTGVVIRKSPDGPGITSIENDHVVELLPDEPVIIDGQEWVHVLVIGQTQTIDGWVVKAYIVFGTPTFTP